MGALNLYMGDGEILKEIERIRKRNRRVEADKAWETSWTRRTIIAAVTYAAISLLLVYINAADPFVVAMVPTTGYILSTLTMPLFKRWWLKNIYNDKK